VQKRTIVELVVTMVVKYHIFIKKKRNLMEGRRIKENKLVLNILELF